METGGEVAQAALSTRVTQACKELKLVGHRQLRALPLTFLPNSVINLREKLTALGYTVFVGESDLEGGQSWTHEIGRAVRDAEVVVVVCSEGYGESKWTLREFEYAGLMAWEPRVFDCVCLPGPDVPGSCSCTYSYPRVGLPSETPC